MLILWPNIKIKPFKAISNHKYAILKSSSPGVYLTVFLGFVNQNDDASLKLVFRVLKNCV